MKYVQENGGLLSLKELADHQSDWVEPITTTYRGYTVFRTVVPQLLQVIGFDGVEHLQQGDPLRGRGELVTRCGGPGILGPMASPWDIRARERPSAERGTWRRLEEQLGGSLPNESLERRANCRAPLSVDLCVLR